MCEMASLFDMEDNNSPSDSDYDEVDPALKELNQLFELIRFRCGRFNSPNSQTLGALLNELGYIFRVKQLWLKCPCLVELSRKIGLYTYFPNDAASIDNFVTTANNSPLKDLILKWIDMNSEGATPDNPSHHYTFL